MQMFADPLFKKSLWNTFYYDLQYSLGNGRGLAWRCFESKVKGCQFFELCFICLSNSGVAVALLWKWIFNPEFGLANATQWFGLPSCQWLASPNWACRPSLL